MGNIVDNKIISYLQYFPALFPFVTWKKWLNQTIKGREKVTPIQFCTAMVYTFRNWNPNLVKQIIKPKLFGVSQKPLMFPFVT